jgi:hypothetical protein
MVREIELFPRLTACYSSSTLKLWSSAETKVRAAFTVSLAASVDCGGVPGAVGVWTTKGKCLQSNEMTFITTLPTKEIGPLLATGAR